MQNKTSIVLGLVFAASMAACDRMAQHMPTTNEQMARMYSAQNPLSQIAPPQSPPKPSAVFAKEPEFLPKTLGKIGVKEFDDMIDTAKNKHVFVLFYASWDPASKTYRQIAQDTAASRGWGFVEFDINEAIVARERSGGAIKDWTRENDSNLNIEAAPYAMIVYKNKAIIAQSLDEDRLAAYAETAQANLEVLIARTQSASAMQTAPAGIQP